MHIHLVNHILDPIFCGASIHSLSDRLLVVRLILSIDGCKKSGQTLRSLLLLLLFPLLGLALLPGNDLNPLGFLFPFGYRILVIHGCSLSWAFFRSFQNAILLSITGSFSDTSILASFSCSIDSSPFVHTVYNTLTQIATLPTQHLFDLVFVQFQFTIIDN